MIKLKSYAAQTHQGPSLKVNEDDIEIDLSNKLYLIMDGFGGAGIGDTAIQKIKELIKNFKSICNNLCENNKLLDEKLKNIETKNES